MLKWSICAFLLNKPTRGQQTLDKIVSNIGIFYGTPSILPPLGSSDHSAVLWSPTDFAPKPNRSFIRTTRPMPDSALREFGQKLTDCDWTSLDDANNIDEKCEAFYSTLLPLIDTYFPTRKVKTHDKDMPWITPKIKSLIKQRQTAIAAGKSTRCRQLRSKISRCITSAKNTFYINRAQAMKKTNPSQWHRSINCMTGAKQSPTTIVVEGVHQNDFTEIARKINEFFINVASDITKLDLATLPSFLPASAPIPLVQPWDVYNELRYTNHRKAGPDGIPAKIIAEFAYELRVPVTHIINASFSQIATPKRWKRAIIVPIPKKPKPSIEDLWPVSLTDHFSKITKKSLAGCL